MQQLIEAEKRRAEAAEKRADEIRAERDDWKQQTIRLALVAPSATPPAPPKPVSVPSVGSGHRRRWLAGRSLGEGWWPWRRAG